MELDEYLKKIEECPDEYIEVDGEKRHRLYQDYNIYDNFQMLLKGNYDKIIGDLKGLGYKVISKYVRHLPAGFSNSWDLSLMG